jgi:hypothetical protein
VGEAPSRGRELDGVSSVAQAHVCVEALAEHFEHRPVLRHDLGDEPIDALCLGDRREALDQGRAQAIAVQPIGDLDGNFGPQAVDLDVGRVTDELASLVVRDQATTIAADLRGPVGRRVEIDGGAEEAEVARLKAQPAEKRAQLWLVACHGATYLDCRPVAQADVLACGNVGRSSQ